MTRALVTGGRREVGRRAVAQILHGHEPKITEVIVVEGDGGPAAFAAEYALRHKIKVCVVSPKTAMEEGKPDLVLVFPGKRSNTATRLRHRAEQTGVPVVAVVFGPPPVSPGEGGAASGQAAQPGGQPLAASPGGTPGPNGSPAQPVASPAAPLGVVPSPGHEQSATLSPHPEGQ